MSQSLVNFACLFIASGAWYGLAGQEVKQLSAQALTRLEPLQVGQAFLRRGERIGVVVTPDDEDTTYMLPPSITAADHARTAEGLEAFSRVNPRYGLQRTPREVLRLQPKKHTRCVDYLQQPAVSFSVEAPVMDVLVAIVRQQQPHLPDVPVGVLGLGSEAERRVFVQRISYSFSGGTMEDALDELVSAAPGTGWLVVERAPDASSESHEPRCEATIFSSSSVVSGF